MKQISKQQMTLVSQLREIARQRQADFFGIADLSRASDFIESQGGLLTLKYPFAVSIGIELFHDIVDALPNRKERNVCVAYRHHCYDIVNNRLDNIVSELSSHVQRLGYKVYPVPASKRVDDQKIAAIFSHKLAAHLSGLGWIGKNCLLITPQAGPRVRFATLLTDAPLNPTGRPIENRCGECRECVDICPVQAFTGRPFNEQEPREARYDARKCEHYFDRITQKNAWALCGLCVYSCPYGKERQTGKQTLASV